MRDDEQRQIRLVTSRPDDPAGKNAGLLPGDKIAILLIIGGQLGIGSALILLACFWREPFLNVLILYGVGSVALCVLCYRYVLNGRGSDETLTIGCWLGLWGLMGLPLCFAAYLIGNWR
jgi:hypothetical protein